MTDTIGGRAADATHPAHGPLHTPPAIPEIVQLPARPAAVVLVAGPVAELPTLIGMAFRDTDAAIRASHALIAGPPFSRYLSFGERIEAEVGFPYSGTLVETERVRRSELPAGPAVRVAHVGPYEEIAVAWDRARLWMEEHWLEARGPGWEVYLTGPEDPGPPVTEVYFPVV
jgi:effector-binding domain-containing protein